ncbi:MAG TPA: diguanylate cyclase [bacterium]|nr:diguanylate cyclase [bacterium]
MRILVVDDSAVIRKMLEEILVAEGFSVTAAPDGIEGLEAVRSGGFDLMFLDIDMPSISGLQVCRMLRNDPQFLDFPIIMLTARGQKQDQFWGLETGADAYMTKPFDRDELLETLQRVMSEKERRSESPKDLTAALSSDNDGSDLIFKAGEVQETQLFKMTLVNSIYQIATRQSDLVDTCRAISDTLSSVVEFDIAMILLKDDNRLKLFVYIYRPTTRDFFVQAKKRLMDELMKDADSGELEREGIDVELHDPEHNMMKAAEEMSLAGFEAAALESKGENFGMFMMARGHRGQFKQEERDIFSLIARQSAIVVDNVRMYEKIKRFAVADGLTGLHNHRYFQEQLEKEYSRSRRFNLSLSLIMMDIDHFKDLNDTYGHQQGDVVLKGMAGVLRRCVRDIDLVARYGGEEFVAILPETPKKNAVIVAERMREMIENMEFEGRDEPLKMTASFGVSGYPDDNIKTRLDLIARADEAMYQAKRGGRNRVALYTPEGRASQ